MWRCRSISLKRWEDLPEYMQNDSVKLYYNLLDSRKFSIAIKRTFDLVMSLILILVLLPIFLVVSLIIILDSPGSPFFCQTRVTSYGKKFKIFKFRTMVKNAEKLGPQVTTKLDFRVTNVGKYLRKFRIDELPQIFNIFCGNLSFVGARPEVPQYVEKYSPEMYATLLLPAGVTSSTSIIYKNESELLENAENPDETYIEKILPQKMEYNLEYIRNFNFFDDIKIMFKTVIAVLNK